MCLRTWWGPYWKVPNVTFICVSSVLWCNRYHLFVISIHSIKLMNALKRNIISFPKFHSFIVLFKDICLHWMFALILPGSSEITCRPGDLPGMEWPACSPDLNPIEQLWDQLGKAMRSIQSAGPTTNPPWTMGCNPTYQDHQTDPQHEEKVPGYHTGIWGINTVMISMWALG